MEWNSINHSSCEELLHLLHKAELNKGLSWGFFDNKGRWSSHFAVAKHSLSFLLLLVNKNTRNECLFVWKWTTKIISHSYGSSSLSLDTGLVFSLWSQELSTSSGKGILIKNSHNDGNLFSNTDLCDCETPVRHQRVFISFLSLGHV